MSKDKPINEPPQWDPDRLRELIQQRAKAIQEANERARARNGMKKIHIQGTEKFSMLRATTLAMESSALSALDRVLDLPPGDRNQPAAWEDIEKLLGKKATDNLRG